MTKAATIIQQTRIPKERRTIHSATAIVLDETVISPSINKIILTLAVVAASGLLCGFFDQQ